jgi:hypothetical protein
MSGIRDKMVHSQIDSRLSNFDIFQEAVPHKYSQSKSKSDQITKAKDSENARDIWRIFASISGDSLRIGRRNICTKSMILLNRPTKSTAKQQHHF